MNQALLNQTLTRLDLFDSLQMHLKRFVISCLLPLFFVSPVVVWAAGNDSDSVTLSHSTKSVQALIERYVDKGGFVFTSPKGVIEHNRYTPFTPASILKIATSAAAFEILGPRYRFATSFYQDTNGDIYIKGSGDPFLTSEEISAILKILASQQLRPYKRLYIDNSYFDLESARPDGANGSANPYDALNSSLAVNFNTLPILLKDNIVFSLEEQTPSIPLMKKYAFGLGQGKHRISISKNADDIVTYAGELFIHLNPDINFSNTVSIGQKVVPEGLHPLYVHQSSKSLYDLISPLLLYSNNFIANQIFLACGANKYGAPATWQKGKNALEFFLNQTLNIERSQFTIREGSGLSWKNKLSPDAMMTILKYFEPQHSLLPFKKNMFIKSGTLTGVYSYAGYISKGSTVTPFVIILNQNTNTRDLILNLIDKNM
jgi:D-alanyl-D-alanine carboxypeptidase/D-alanyl-D-alanine-endopeptidase (penicillin-binding protein 4)